MIRVYETMHAQNFIWTANANFRNRHNLQQT